MKLDDKYNESNFISTRLSNAIKRIIFKFCTFEELLSFEVTLLKRIDGIQTHQELVDMFNIIKAKKKFKNNLKIALTNK